MLKIQARIDEEFSFFFLKYQTNYEAESHFKSCKNTCLWNDSPPWEGSFSIRSHVALGSGKNRSWIWFLTINTNYWIKLFFCLDIFLSACDFCDFSLTVRLLSMSVGRLCFVSQCTMYNVQLDVGVLWASVQRTTYNVQRTTYNVQRTTYNIQRTTYNVQSTVYNVQYIIYNV